MANNIEYVWQLTGFFFFFSYYFPILFIFIVIYFLRYLFTYLFFFFLLCINVVNLLSIKKKDLGHTHERAKAIVVKNAPDYGAGKPSNLQRYMKKIAIKGYSLEEYVVLKRGTRIQFSFALSYELIAEL